MKTWGIFVLIFYSVAFSTTRMFCQDDPRSLRAELVLENDTLRMRVQNPLGYAWFPFIEGPVAPAQLNFLKYEAQQLKPLSDDFWVEWKSADCQIELRDSVAGSRVECSHRSRAASVEKIQFNSLTVATLTENSFAGEWKSFRFRLNVSVEGESGSDFFFTSWTLSDKGCAIFH